MHLAATVGLTIAIIGGVLLFAVGGGAWSDVPGGILLVAGALIELACTLAIVGRKVRARS